ncbi:hypothetical protein FHS96_003775 [Sphingomonas zeicaulis]|uniref:hypothetical protein n=1 Tax=Sphingomonas zeicaulis TaxID=1632740 RepID=UPI003D21861F
MTHLRTVEGNGQLVAEGNVIGPVRYRLNVFQDHHDKWADGIIEGEVASSSIIDAGRAIVVHRPSGDTFQLMIVRPETELRHLVVRSCGPFPEH